MSKYTLMAHQDEGVAFLDSMDGIAALLYDPGVGKQQPVSEPVLTPNGWSPIGDVQPGDYVIGSDGQPTEVLSRHPQADRRVLRVTFSDGAWTDTGPDHLWSARTHNDTNRGRDYQVVTTEQLGSSLGSRWEIPMTAPVGGPDAVLPADPYFYGVMLGDGYFEECHGLSVILTTDNEILDALGLSYTAHKTCAYVGEAYVPRDRTRALGLTAQRSEEKAVDSRYMRASATQRLALLQGLLDTDGSPIRTGGVEFSSTSPHLRDAVVELAESLGGSARIGAERYPTYTYKGEKRTGQLSYRVNVKMPAGVLPFRLSRKLGAWVAPVKYNAKRVVRSVEYVREEDSVCIRVAALDSLYLTRRHIVTHNTGTTLAWADKQAKRRGEFRVLVFAPLTAADTWVLQAGPFMDSTVKARMLEGSTKDILTKIGEANDWTNVPDTRVMDNHRGDPATRSRVTILSVSAGAVSSWCRDDPRKEVTRADGTTYEVGTDLDKRQRTVMLLKAVRKFKPDLVVVDESQIIKSANANLSTALYQVGQLADHRIILTGTVNPKDMLDCYGQWRFLAPWTFSDQHGEDYTKSPLTMDKAEKAGIRPWNWTRFCSRYGEKGGYKGKGITGINAFREDELKNRIAERSHVVRKEDALDLPPVVDVDIHVTLDTKSARLYQEMREDLAAMLDSGELLEAPNALAKLMKLRQITAGFIKDTTETSATFGQTFAIGTAKQKAVADLVNTTLVSENRLVVFAYFKSEVAAIAKLLAAQGRTVEVITGATANKERLAIRQRFADTKGNPGQMILVAQQRTMSLSVNELVVAKHAVFASMSERRDDWVQARGRLDRNGQTGSKVTFWNVYCPGTVDQVMLETHKHRGRMEKALLDHIRLTIR